MLKSWNKSRCKEHSFDAGLGTCGGSNRSCHGVSTVAALTPWQQRNYLSCLATQWDSTYCLDQTVTKMVQFIAGIL